MINKIDVMSPIVSDQGMATVPFRTFINQTQRRGLITGVGSPEGVVEATVGQEYMDETGTAGNIKYIKRDDNIAGDKSQGWILI